MVKLKKDLLESIKEFTLHDFHCKNPDDMHFTHIFSDCALGNNFARFFKLGSNFRSTIILLRSFINIENIIFYIIFTYFGF